MLSLSQYLYSMKGCSARKDSSSSIKLGASLTSEITKKVWSAQYWLGELIQGSCKTNFLKD